MNKRFFSKKLFSMLLISFGLFSQSGYSQSAATIINALNSIRASIDGLVSTAATYIFQTPPYVGNELTANAAQNTAIQTIAPNVKTLNDQDILNGLSPNIKNPNQNLTQLASIQASDTVLPSITIGGIPVPFFSSAVQQNMQNSLVQGNENFNFQSLVTPLNYSTQQAQNYALNYIRFISGYATPISNLNLNSYTESQLSVKQKMNIQNSADYQGYQVLRRQFLAEQSAALTTLYSVYSRRLPDTSIKAGSTPLGVDSPSPAQIENYNATWRTSSQAWYTQMATASPSVVQRETLFILAELQTEIHKMRQEQERLILITAINQLAGLQTAKTTLAIAEKQVQDSISQQVKQNAQQGTTNTSIQNQPGQSQNQRNQAQQLKQTEEQIKAQEQQAKEQAKSSK